MGAALGEDVRPIPSVPPGQKIALKHGETIGFCYPVHAWRPPMLFREFVSRCNIANPEGHYCWALCTAGDDIGESMDIIRQDLERARLHVDSTFSLLMPNTYVGLPGMDVDSPETERQKILQAEKKIELCIRHVLNRDSDVHLLDKSRWPRTNSRLLGPLFSKYLIKDDFFTVDRKTCLRCGRCVRVCPAANIAMDKDNQPKWLHTGKCLTCMACYHHCPAQSIQWGKATHGKGHYWYGHQSMRSR